MMTMRQVWRWLKRRWEAGRDSNPDDVWAQRQHRPLATLARRERLMKRIREGADRE